MFANNFRYSTIVALLLLATNCASAITTTLSQENYNNICLLTKAGERISSAHNCNQYYLCQNGVARLQTCPQGYAYDKDMQQCLPSANCGQQPSVNPCNAENIGEFKPVAGSCTKYYYCSAMGGGLQGSCPTGQNFNPQTQACVFPTTYPCGIIETSGNGQTGAVNLCAFMPNNKYFGSTSSCSDWAICKNNEMETGDCPEGYVFNPSITKCDFKVNVVCSQVTNDPNLIYLPSINGKCTTQGQRKAAAQCNAYYECNGINYLLNFCGKGFFYDVVSKSCASRLNARNNCDRCFGSKLSFVNAYSNKDCSGYLYCKNGVKQHVGFCEPGSYFDEKAGGCVADTEPVFGCCNPAYVHPPNTAE